MRGCVECIVFVLFLVVHPVLLLTQKKLIVFCNYPMYSVNALPTDITIAIANIQPASKSIQSDDAVYSGSVLRGTGKQTC